jgi:hypothetical protein
MSVHGSVLTSASQSVCLSVGQCGTQVNIKALFFAHSAAKNIKISNFNIKFFFLSIDSDDSFWQIVSATITHEFLS